MKKSPVFAIAIIAAMFVMAISASAAMKTAETSFEPMTTAAVTNIINLSGEVLNIGIRSTATNAYSVAITDFSTGAAIYTGTDLTSTSYNLYPKVAATGTTGAALTNTLGNIYVPANVVKLRVIASCAGSTNNALTVAAVVNDSP